MNETPEHKRWCVAKRTHEIICDHILQMCHDKGFDQYFNCIPNLDLVYNSVSAKLDNKRRNGIIDDWQIECSRKNNPLFRKKYQSCIVFEYDVKIPGSKGTWTAFVKLEPNNSHYTTNSPMEPDAVDTGHTSDDTYAAYDHAMGIIR